MCLCSLQRKDCPEEVCLAFQLQVESVRAFPLWALWGSAVNAAAEGALLLAEGMCHRGKVCLLGNVCFQWQEGELDKQV